MSGAHVSSAGPLTGGLAVASPPDQPVPACAGLSPAMVWDDAAALRGDFFTPEKLADHALEIARVHGEPTFSVPAGPLRRRFAKARAQLMEAYEALAKQAATPHDATPAEEWLLDNSHVVRDQLREIEEDLPPGYLTRLPRLAGGSMAGYPRVYALCLDYLRHTDARIEQETLVPYVAAYQRVSPLTIGELWAVPIMLRLGLVLSVGGIAEREANDTERTRADALGKTLLATSNPSPTAELARAGKRPMTAAFLVQVIRRLREHESPAVSDWISAQAEALGSTPEALVRQQHLRQAADQVSVGNAITSMRAIGALDWNRFFERTSLVEEILGGDPAKAYGATEPRSRDRYRHVIEDLARRSHFDERSVAKAAVGMAAEAQRTQPGDPGVEHVGFYLVDDGRAALERKIEYRPSLARRARCWVLRHPTGLYLGSILAITLLMIGGGLAAAKGAGQGPGILIGLGLLLALPASEVALTLLNALVTAMLPPRILSKLDFQAGIPAGHATLVAVPSMLDGDRGIRKLLEDLEIRSLANTDEALTFALVTDFTDHKGETHEEDARLLKLARDGVAELNRRHRAGQPDRYFLLHRSRQHNPIQGMWMGWERKRGKLEELNRLLRGAADTSFTVVTAKPEQLRQVKYVITLDADTQLPREVARKLVATIAHPLNRPRHGPDGRVIRGYGIVQPRVGTRPTSTRQSRFAKIAAGQAGIDPYTSAVSDVYQDLFAEGSYIGKGIYDVDAFDQALRDRVPSDALLSHDLFEGVHARTALATDIEVLDDQPASYGVFAGRQHRWVRGDWQLLPWLKAHVPHKAGTLPNPLPLIARWRFADNLRRSLVAPSMIGLLAFGWFGAPALAAVATAALLVLTTAPLYGWLALTMTARRSDRSPSRLTVLRGDLGTNCLRAVLGLAFLLDQSVSMADAAVRTLHRMFVSKRNLLEWTTMSAAEQSFNGRSYRKRLPITSGFAAAALVALAILRPISLGFGGPVLLLWVFAPLIANWLSQPPTARPRSRPLTADDRRLFRLLARKTWSFFETFVTADESWLPPDNFQQEPRPVIAHRTSPTNIGLYLMSAVAARDFGYLTLAALCRRLEDTLDTIDRLEKREGHILNWYETTTLKPLEPQYISTVDSGNLAAYCWALRQACLELCNRPIVDAAVLEAAVDALALCEAEVQTPRARRSGVATRAALAGELTASHAKLDQLPGALATLEELVEKTAELRGAEALVTQDNPHRGWMDRAEGGLERAADEVRLLAPWTRLARSPPLALVGHPGWKPLRDRMIAARSLTQIVAMVPEAEGVLAALESDAPPQAAGYLSALGAALAQSKKACEARIAALQLIGTRACAFADGMNFRFLYDDQRSLFSIGYNVSSSRLDGSYYDLLASEARLASLVSIAKGDAPLEHWFHLGRPRTQLTDGRALLSWSGSMFEYLMPLLVTKHPSSTLLEETCAGAIDRQREYGKERDVPWGVSESAYNTMDLSMTYQYRAFGVPGLGLKAGLGEDLVVAPYATVLAAMVQPGQAADNLRVLDKSHLAGPFGFYESIDYTPSHLPPGKRGVVVKCFMAHHQGMSLVALDNVLNGSPMQRRFHRDARVRATELLLEERIPLDAPLHEVIAQTAAQTSGGDHDLDAVEHVGVASEPLRLHVLGHGDLSTVVSGAGTGQTTWKGMDLYRFREDRLDPCGLFLYLRDLDSGAVWSAGHEPIRKPATSYDAAFSADRVEIRRRDDDLETLVEVGVSPEHPAEVRRLTLTNHGAAARTIELTTYTEVVLAPRGNDLAHRAFSSMFLQTEAVPERGALLARRRGRSPNEAESYLVQVLAPEDGEWTGTEHETSRAQFIGRGRTVRDPVALEGRAALSGTTGDVLDPILALRRQVRIEPGKTARISLTSALSPTRAGALELAGVFSSVQSVARTFELGWADARVELKHLGINGAQAERNQKLLSLLFFPRPALRSTPRPGAPGRTKDALWSQGISGDLPIVVLRVDDTDFAPLATELLSAHEFWRLNGIACDLVFLNDEPGSYAQPLQNQTLALVEASPAHAHQNQRGGIFIRRSDQLTPEARSLLLGAARVVLNASAGSLGRQVRNAWKAEAAHEAAVRAPEVQAAASTPLPRPALKFDNGIGGFSEDGREYVMKIGPGSLPPAPWCNVIANPDFGCVISERGGGFTWASNSQSHRLTPWSNDAVSDPLGEVIYLRDEATGEVWSATPAPCGGNATYRVKHGQGSTTFEHERGGLSQALTVFVCASEPVKVSRLKLTNSGTTPRRLSVIGYVEWVLGSVRDRTRLTTITELDAESGVVFAQNPASLFGEKRAFFSSSPRCASATADRDAFFGPRLDRTRPMALEGGPLTARSGGGLEPCAALQLAVELQPGEAKELSFVLGEGRDRAHALELGRRFQDPAQAGLELEKSLVGWNQVLGAVTVKTPDPALDVMLNRWLLYQALSSRLWARSGFYQSGGAYGFRDQLQDVMALVHSEPRLAREHIVRAAARQFTEGDVQHWWHPESGEGVRTHCSDDMLWLPFVTAHYVRTTGDFGVLDATAPFLETRKLEPGEDDLFNAPAISAQAFTIYEHCLRAIDNGLTSGPHGLPLMRAGDWNDGMNRVGKEGVGESVWLAWFAVRTMHDFAQLASARGDEVAAKKLLDGVARVTQAIERNAWDGGWYRRAWFDDGAVLGSHENDECQIDAIAQSWAVIAGTGDGQRAQTAVRASDQMLFRPGEKMMRLFTPPFEKNTHDPGYIAAYPVGVRENGGQYTHGVLWTVLATALMGDGDRAMQLLSAFNPVHHGGTPEDAARYAVEPYVVVADVYALKHAVGRGGWSWYTGSAAWMYRIGLEHLLGVQLRGGKLVFAPCIPKDWKRYEVEYRCAGGRYQIAVENPLGICRGKCRVELDGAVVESGEIPLDGDGGEHRVTVIIG